MQYLGLCVTKEADNLAKKLLKCSFASIACMNINKKYTSSILLGVTAGVSFLAFLGFLSPINLEAQPTGSSSSTTTNASDIIVEQQQQEQEQSSQGGSTDEENNKEIIIAFTNASNDRNYTAIEQYVAENIIEHRPSVQSGRNSTIQFLQSLANAFPDFHTNIDHIVAEGDRVVVFTTTNGTHEGECVFAPGIPPTGKQLSFKTADMYRISNGQLVEHWDVIEILDLMTQIGAITFSQPVSPLPDSATNTTMMTTTTPDNTPR